MTTPDDSPLSQEELLRYNQWRNQQGLGMVPQRYIKVVRTVSVSDPAWDALRELAVEHGLTRQHGGNISELLECIGQGLLVVKPAGNEP